MSVEVAILVERRALMLEAAAGRIAQTANSSGEPCCQSGKDYDAALIFGCLRGLGLSENGVRALRRTGFGRGWFIIGHAKR